MEFDLRKISRDKLLIQLFKIVQKIKFKFIPFDNSNYPCKEAVTANLTEGDSRHKTKVLYNLLMQTNYETEKAKVIFDWKDLPIPAKILGILKKSTTRQANDIIEIKLNPYSKSYIDPTWDPMLKELGFPITEEWNGKESTKQISRGKVEYVSADDFKPEEHGIKVNEKEWENFTKKFNEWIGKIRKQ